VDRIGLGSSSLKGFDVDSTAPTGSDAREVVKVSVDKA